MEELNLFTNHSDRIRKNPVLPESLRPFGTKFHYGKNDIDHHIQTRIPLPGAHRVIVTSKLEAAAVMMLPLIVLRNLKFSLVTVAMMGGQRPGLRPTVTSSDSKSAASSWTLCQ